MKHFMNYVTSRYIWHLLPQTKKRLSGNTSFTHPFTLPNIVVITTIIHIGHHGFTKSQNDDDIVLIIVGCRIRKVVITWQFPRGSWNSYLGILCILRAKCLIILMKDFIGTRVGTYPWSWVTTFHRSNSKVNSQPLGAMEDTKSSTNGVKSFGVGPCSPSIR